MVRVHDADEKYRTRPLARKKTESQRRVRGSISRIRWLTEAACSEIAAVWLNRRKSSYLPNRRSTSLHHHQDRELQTRGIFHDCKKKSRNRPRRARRRALRRDGRLLRRRRPRGGGGPAAKKRRRAAEPPRSPRAGESTWGKTLWHTLQVYSVKKCV